MVGPFQEVQVGEGRTVDLYLLRFSADGGLLSPRTQQHLADHLAEYTEVFLFSHGWNNTFDDALARQEGIFLYLVLDRARANLAMARFRLAGIEKDLKV